MAAASIRAPFDSEYAWKTHLVTAAKYAEYAVLAPAVVLLVRDARALARLIATAPVWPSLAAIVAVLQYFGVDILGAWPSGWRQPSFVGVAGAGRARRAPRSRSDSWACSRAGLGRARASRIAALAGGTVCVVLSGGIAAELAVVLAAVAPSARAGAGRRRLAAHRRRRRAHRRLRRSACSACATAT